MREAWPPAKVNLTLEVARRRPDTYHDLRSIFLRIGLTDRLTVRLAPPAATADTLTLSGMPGVPVAGNLVLRAFDALRTRAGLPLPPLDATLDKQIPAAAGLGGGSSDAAAALGLAQLAWGISLSPSETLAVGASIGSDVPFFLADATLAEVGGRGEIVSLLPSNRLAVNLIVVTPPISLSTGRVFHRHDQLAPHASGAGAAAKALLDMVLDEPSDGDVVAWSRDHPDANDLWPAAASLEPSLVQLRQALQRATGHHWLLSGSGPSLFALYASAEEAAEAGRSVVDSRSPELTSASIHAVDLAGPNPIWRFP